MIARENEAGKSSREQATRDAYDEQHKFNEETLQRSNLAVNRGTSYHHRERDFLHRRTFGAI